jgi:hypothetical protein
MEMRVEFFRRLSGGRLQGKREEGEAAGGYLKLLDIEEPRTISS